MRKELTVVATEGRDKGKTFLLKELSAMRVEKWAARAFLALARSGVDMPDDLPGTGFAGLGLLGIKALTQIKFAEAEPLLDEMLSCVTFIPDPSRSQFARALIEDDIEELATLLMLRREVITLHTGFSLPGGP